MKATICTCLALFFWTINLAQNGIPNISVDYGSDVMDWWGNHPYNPDGTSYMPTIISPTNSLTLSSGNDIQAVIDTLTVPTTIYLNDGIYDGFEIIGKSDIHIIGLGENVRIGNQTCHVAPTQLAATDYGGYLDCLVAGNATCLTPYQNPPHNIYFKKMTFDGGNNLNIALWTNRVFDMLIEDCIFQNYVDLNANHLGLISGRMGSKNLWIRNCQFIGNQRFAIYLDGCHGCGTMDSYIDEHFGSGAILYLANDDYSRDYNNNNSQDPDELLIANYNIIYRNTFEGWMPKAASIMGANSLVLENTVLHEVNTFTELTSKASHVWSGVEYEYYGNKILGNTLEDRAILEFVWVDKFNYSSLPLGNDFTVGNYTIRCNEIKGSGILLTETGSPIDGPNVVEGNCINDPNCMPCDLTSAVNKLPLGETIIRVFPNPVADVLHLEILQPIAANYSLLLLDITGEMVHFEEHLSQNTTINMRDLERGIYFLQVFSENGVEVKKVVKQ